MESDSSGLILLDSQEVELFIVQSQKSAMTFFRSPRVKSTTLYEELGTMVPAVGDKTPAVTNWGFPGSKRHKLSAEILTAPLR